MNEAVPVQERTLHVATVRYGKMLLTARFKTDNVDLVRKRDRCVVRTDRGREFGTVLTAPEPLPAGLPPEGFGDILRRATADDLNNDRRIEGEMRVKAMQICRDEIKKLVLAMKLVECDYLMGGERIIFYFLSEGRIVRSGDHRLATELEAEGYGATVAAAR